MTGDPRMFTSLDEQVDEQERITFGDHSISNVLYVASLSFNLLSVGQLCNLGFQCLFTEKEVVVSKKDDDHVGIKAYLIIWSASDVDYKLTLN